jgi:hypothetical protein
MARRRAAKARKKPISATARPPHGSAKVPTQPTALKERLAAAERERDNLRADVDRLQARLTSMEKAHAQVRDRIAWALDSLHKILGGS